MFRIHAKFDIKLLTWWRNDSYCNHSLLCNCCIDFLLNVISLMVNSRSESCWMNWLFLSVIFHINIPVFNWYCCFQVVRMTRIALLLLFSTATAFYIPTHEEKVRSLHKYYFKDLTENTVLTRWFNFISQFPLIPVSSMVQAERCVRWRLQNWSAWRIRAGAGEPGELKLERTPVFE